MTVSVMNNLTKDFLAGRVVKLELLIKKTIALHAEEDSMCTVCNCAYPCPTVDMLVKENIL